MQVKAGVKDAFRKAPDREMVKARVKVQVKVIQKCLLNCTPVAAVALLLGRGRRRRSRLEAHIRQDWGGLG